MRWFCVIATIWFSAVPTVRAAEKWALVVGVNDCADFRCPDGSRPRPLRGAESDAEALGALLMDQFGFDKPHVRVLLGKQATLESIRKAMAEIARAARTDDAVVFYFAGHGTQIRDARPLDEQDGLDEALCCYDVTADGKNLLLDDELGLWLDDLAAVSVTVILDSCHSGTGIKDPDDDLAPRFLPMHSDLRRPTGSHDPWSDLKPTTKSLTAKHRIALFACQPEQQAYERRFPGQQAPARSGQFTRYLLDGLRANAADADGNGQITGSEAVAYVKRQLDGSFNASRSRPKERQEPLVETSAGDKPVFLGTR
jgi:uncharacterized caspase-like protein